MSTASNVDGGDANAFASALHSLDLACAVEARARLALLVADAETVQRLAADATRREVIALARAHGFTNVAVELAPMPGRTGAPLLRD
ncbi:MAG TPA: hypothetical protein VFI52_05325 [Gemmatimonadaceae bacterium]|nr:hypothetical protein [Gemmatimonadaceae bacterium]